MIWNSYHTVNRGKLRRLPLPANTPIVPGGTPPTVGDLVDATRVSTAKHSHGGAGFYIVESLYDDRWPSKKGEIYLARPWDGEEAPERVWATVFPGERRRNARVIGDLLSL